MEGKLKPITDEKGAPGQKEFKKSWSRTEGIHSWRQNWKEGAAGRVIPGKKVLQVRV